MKKNKWTKRILLAGAAVLFLIAAAYLYPFLRPLYIGFDFVSGYSYTVYADHVELESYERNAETVWVPGYLWGRPVTVLGSRCLTDKDMKILYLPNHLQEIRYGLFSTAKNWKWSWGGRM